MSAHVPVGNGALSMRGVLVGSCPTHHAEIDARSSAIFPAPAANVSGLSAGTAQTAGTCAPVVVSGRSTADSPEPHQSAANAPGAHHSAAPATSRTTSL